MAHVYVDEPLQRALQQTRPLLCRMNLFSNFVPISFLVLLPALCASPCLAEELEPRRWAHLPINTNFIGSGYAYTEADIGFDPVLKIEDAELEMHTWLAKYIRSFALLDGAANAADL